MRASLGGPDEHNDVGMKGTAGGAGLEPGRVILCVPDMSLVDFFREQFSQLPAPVEVSIHTEGHAFPSYLKMVEYGGTKRMLEALPVPSEIRFPSLFEKECV